jgi:hypothetical protein
MQTHTHMQTRALSTLDQPRLRQLACHTLRAISLTVTPMLRAHRIHTCARQCRGGKSSVWPGDHHKHVSSVSGVSCVCVSVTGIYLAHDSWRSDRCWPAPSRHDVACDQHDRRGIAMPALHRHTAAFQVFHCARHTTSRHAVCDLVEANHSHFRLVSTVTERVWQVGRRSHRCTRLKVCVLGSLLLTHFFLPDGMVGARAHSKGFGQPNRVRASQVRKSKLKLELESDLCRHF